MFNFCTTLLGRPTHVGIRKALRFAVELFLHFTRRRSR